MKTESCPECNGDKVVRIQTGYIDCPTCDGTGTIPDELVNHCQACGEPILPGEIWCNFHKAAAELEGRGDE